jgi:hypothetical protein
LREEDAQALLDSVLAWPLDAQVRDRIVAETYGNPLALLELPRGLTQGQLAGGFGLPDAMPLSGRIEESFRRQLEGLPPETQQLLQVAAADPSGDLPLVWRAADRLGISVQAAAPAIDAGAAAAAGGDARSWARHHRGGVLRLRAEPDAGMAAAPAGRGAGGRFGRSGSRVGSGRDRGV